MKFTRGEARGVVALGVVLAVILAVMAWRPDLPVAHVEPPRLPDAVRTVADSVETVGCDTVRVGEGARRLGSRPVGVRTKKTGRQPGVSDRRSPLDEPV